MMKHSKSDYTQNGAGHGLRQRGWQNRWSAADGPAAASAVRPSSVSSAAGIPAGQSLPGHPPAAPSVSMPCGAQALDPASPTATTQVFLPAAGNRNGTTINNAGSNGYYWSSTPNGTTNAYNLNFNGTNVNPQNNNNRYNGFSVRLVQDSAPRYDLLTDLFQAYYDARRNKRNTHSQLQFEIDMERNLIELYHELRDRTYRPGSSICFVVDEPVKREVFASGFRDRVVHHLYYNYVAPIFERVFIYDSYSCREGKGTLKGIERLEHHIRSCTRNFTREAYVLKLDISGYFMSIDRRRLCDMALDTLERYRCRPAPGGGTWEQQADYDLLRYLTRVITQKNPLDDCRMRGSRSRWEGLPDSKCLSKSPEGVGMPIGDLTSQLFSNLYLNVLDQYVKRVLNFMHYGRYVDDFYIVDTDRPRLRRAIGRIRGLLQQLGLRLHPKKVVLLRATQGIAFLGAVCRRRCRHMSRRTQLAMRRCVSRLWQMADSMTSPPALLPPPKRACGLASLRDQLVRLLSYAGYMEHFVAVRFYSSDICSAR